MKKHKSFQSGSLHAVILVGASVVLLALLGWIFWQRLNAENSTTDSVEKVSISKAQKVFAFPNWDVQIPLPSTSSEFAVDSNSYSAVFAEGGEMSSYGVSLKGGSGCHATPDYVASIMRVRTDAVIVKSSSPLANTRSIDGHYGETWLRYYRQKLEENKDGSRFVQGVKELGEYAYVLTYLPSKCAAPDSSTDEGKKINQLRDHAAAELKSVFNGLEPSA